MAAGIQVIGETVRLELPVRPDKFRATQSAACQSNHAAHLHDEEFFLLDAEPVSTVLGRDLGLPALNRA